RPAQPTKARKGWLTSTMLDRGIAPFEASLREAPQDDGFYLMPSPKPRHPEERHGNAGARLEGRSSDGRLPLYPALCRRQLQRWNDNRQSRSEEHTSELQSLRQLVCRLLLEKKKASTTQPQTSTGTIALSLPNN